MMPELGAQFDEIRGQQHLFDKKTVPHFQDLSPHLQTREQFESTPGTWFHSGRQRTIPRSSSFDNLARPRPFHAGTQKAALERARVDYAPSWEEVYQKSSKADLMTPGYKKQENGRAWMHSFRNEGPVEEDITGDYDANDRSEAWFAGPLRENPGILYTNAVEDVGSTSLVTQGTKGLKSHGDYVREAKARGERVSPIAEAQAAFPSGRVLHPEEFKEYGVKPPHRSPNAREAGGVQLNMFDQDARKDHVGTTGESLGEFVSEPAGKSSTHEDPGDVIHSSEFAWGSEPIPSGEYTHEEYAALTKSQKPQQASRPVWEKKIWDSF